MDIDFVVLWVDGSDPAWQAEMHKYEGSPDDGNSVIRFRDWGLMRYWFRAVDKFAPWVRRIHFVTDGQLPSFLDLSDPRLNVVRHADFMPPDALPCFNSCALEMNLFRIEDLAEHFVYFNDDTFLTRPVKPETFFDIKTGLPHAQFCERAFAFRDDPMSWAFHFARDIGLINKWFPKKSIPASRYLRLFLSLKNPPLDNLRSLAMLCLHPYNFTGFKTPHTCLPYRKSTFETIWSKEPERLRITTYSRFRSWEDVNQKLAFLWQLVSGEFSPRRSVYRLFYIRSDEIEQICRAIAEQSFDSVCLNDDSPSLDYDGLSRKLAAAFEAALPEKCPFEK